MHEFKIITVLFLLAHSLKNKAVLCGLFCFNIQLYVIIFIVTCSNSLTTRSRRIEKSTCIMYTVHQSHRYYVLIFINLIHIMFTNVLHTMCTKSHFILEMLNDRINIAFQHPSTFVGLRYIYEILNVYKLKQ